MRRAALLCLCAALAGCIPPYQPAVDMKGVDQAGLARDVGECRDEAQRVYPAGPILVYTVIGATMGAGLGLLVAGGGTAAGWGALAGGATGAGVGAVAPPPVSPQDYIDECLRNRGYIVEPQPVPGSPATPAYPPTPVDPSAPVYPWTPAKP